MLINQWLMLTDADWCWLILSNADTGWCWLIAHWYWFWLILIDADWSMINDHDPCRMMNKLIKVLRKIAKKYFRFPETKLLFPTVGPQPRFPKFTLSLSPMYVCVSVCVCYKVLARVCLCVHVWLYLSMWIDSTVYCGVCGWVYRGIGNRWPTENAIHPSWPT